MNILSKFSKVIGYDLEAYLIRFSEFIANDYPNILAYFQGRGDVVRGSFIELDVIIKQSKEIDNATKTSVNRLTEFAAYWDIFDDLETIREKLRTIKNLAKWSRSSFSGQFNQNTVFDYTLKQNENIELTATNLGSADPQNDWVDIAFSNRLKEIDYDSSGGELLKVKLRDDSVRNIRSVVDTLTGDNILGKDINKDLTVIDNDLQVFESTEALEQSINTKFQLRKGDIPELGFLGMSIFEGSSVNFIRYPVIFRELAQIVRQDDTIKSLELIDLKRSEDTINMQIRVTSKRNDTVDKTLQI